MMSKGTVEIFTRQKIAVHLIINIKIVKINNKTKI